MHKKSESITFASLKTIKRKSFVIVEDIISLNKDEENQLRIGINYTAHHKQSKLFCVTHTVYKTGIFSMLPLFNSIIFTSSASNTPIVRAALNYFKIDKEKIAEWLEQMKLWSPSLKANPAYFFFDCTSMAFCLATYFLEKRSFKILGSLLDDGAPSEQHRQLPPSAAAPTSTTNRCSNSRAVKNQAAKNTFPLLQQKFSEFFTNHPFQSQAQAIFSIILERFGNDKIDPVDLTVSFRSRKVENARKKISTVDYVAELLASRKRASVEHLVLHAYISKTCVIPQSCIKNEAFLAHQHAK